MPATRGIEPVDSLPGLTRGGRGLRLVRKPKAERADVSFEMLNAYDVALEHFERLGAEVVEIALPFRFADLMSVQASAVTNAEAYFVNGRLAEDPEAPLGEAVRAQAGPARPRARPPHDQRLVNASRYSRTQSSNESGVIGRMRSDAA